MTQGTCPVCNGTCRVPVGGHQYKSVLAGYDRETDTLQCRNCGSQYMFGRSTGQVNLNRHDEPCTHSYTSQTVGRCLTEYTCQHCNDRYQIDSGD